MSEPMYATIAYDPADGRILRVHFTRAAAGSPESEATAAWVWSVAPAGAKMLHVPPGSMEAGKAYRVDVATGTLIVVAAGEGGVWASASGIRLG